MCDDRIFIGFTFSIVLNLAFIITFIQIINPIIDENSNIKSINKIDNACIYSLKGSYIEIKADCNKYKIGDKVFK